MITLIIRPFIRNMSAFLQNFHGTHQLHVVLGMTARTSMKIVRILTS